MKVSTINNGLSTLNVYLIIIGYAFVTTLFLPISSDIDGVSRIVTVPFRAVCLLISLLVIGLNVSKKIKLNPFIKLIFAFWALYIFKLCWVISIYPSTVASQFNNTIEYYVYAIGIVFIPMLSVICSSQNIEIEKLFKTVYLSGITILILSMVSNNNFLGSEMENMRQNGNMAFNTISYGHLAIGIALISLYILLFKENSRYIQLFLIAGLMFSLYISFRAGSRSPIFAFIFTVTIMLLSKFKNLFMGVGTASIFILLLILFWGGVNSIIASVSPIMAERIKSTEIDNTSDRIILINDAWSQFLDSPIFGNDFVLTNGFATGSYPHNIIVESFMSTGFIGGILMVILIVAAVIQSISILKKNNKYGGFIILFLQYMILQMFSGNLYTGNLFFCLLAYVLMIPKQTEDTKREEEVTGYEPFHKV